jgi:hypothetical protein
MRGRGAEYETVLGLLDGTQQGRGRLLLVEGEPGTGKSLLLAQAGEEAGRRGFAWGPRQPASSARPLRWTGWRNWPPPGPVLAKGTPSGAGPAGLRFDLLESDGAARISLEPLDHEAQLALIGDVLGAVPDQTLIELAADAAMRTGLYSPGCGCRVAGLGRAWCRCGVPVPGGWLGFGGLRWGKRPGAGGGGGGGEAGCGRTGGGPVLWPR